MVEELPFLPCLEPNDAPRAATLASVPFAYEGRPLTLPEFASYLTSYDFGTIPPDQICLHNTANPDASWAPLSTSDRTWWDRDEAGLSLTAIRNKRNTQLDHIRDYYVSLGWDAGPHLFIDDKWIWLFTPMREIGVHAKEGNSYRDSAGRLHYSIGVETIGWFGKQGWPPAMQALLRGAVQALRARLGTFEIVYKGAITHQPARHQGSISFHFDYNKPSCPGGVITPEYAISILAGPPAPIPLPDTPTMPDPLKAEKLPAPGGKTVACSERVAGFYAVKGGAALFGLALMDETRATGSDGRICSYVRCERVVIKSALPEGPHLALIDEAIKQRWL